MQLSAWHRRTAAAVAAAHPLDGRPARATGNHLAAQNDEPESTPSPLYRAFCDLADARDERNEAIRADYVRRLREHDWEFEHSDDYSVTRRGAEELQQLRAMQRELDADYAIWNRHAPVGYRIEGVAA